MYSTGVVIVHWLISTKGTVGRAPPHAYTYIDHSDERSGAAYGRLRMRKLVTADISIAFPC